MKGKKGRHIIVHGLIVLLLVLYAVIIILPLLWMVMSGLKTNRELFLSPWTLPEVLNFSNYLKAWSAGIGRYFLNSVIVTALATALDLFCSCSLAFALSRYRFRGSKALLMFVISGLMLAPQVSLISNYRLLQWLHLYDTYFAIIIPTATFRIPFTTFLIWSYLVTMDKDLEEAAAMEGGRDWQALVYILMPLLKPILATGILLTAKYAWNDFLFPLVFTESSALKTIPYGLSSMQSTQDTNWTVLLAALTISALPMVLLFILLQKQFVRGLAAGGVKG